MIQPLTVISDAAVAREYLHDADLDAETFTDVSAMILERDATEGGAPAVLLVCASGTVLAKTTLQLLDGAVTMLVAATQGE